MNHNHGILGSPGGMDPKALAEALTREDVTATAPSRMRGAQVKTGEQDPLSVLHEVVRLFSQRGVENTSYRAIVKATGLSRKALYRTWPNKQTLIVEALAFYRKNELAPLMSALDKGGKSGLSDFWQKNETAFRKPGWRGCLLFRTAAAPQGSTVAIDNLFNDYIEELHDRISRAVAEGQRAGEISAVINADAAGWQCVSILSLISSLGARKGHTRLVDDLVATARRSCGLSLTETTRRELAYYDQR